MTVLAAEPRLHNPLEYDLSEHDPFHNRLLHYGLLHCDSLRHDSLRHDSSQHDSSQHDPLHLPLQPVTLYFQRSGLHPPFAIFAVVGDFDLYRAGA